MPEVTTDEAGARCSDVVRQMIVDGHAGAWAAIRLSDGGSDGVAYPSKADAVRHQLHETLCAYVRVPRDDMGPRDAARFMEINRLVYDAGCRLGDPDAPDGLELRAPDRIEDLAAAVREIERQAGMR